MKHSILILAFTAIAAITALIFGRSLGTREDVSCVLGGLIGFAISSIFGGRKPSQIEASDASAICNATKAAIVAYFAFSISCFAFIGWLKATCIITGQMLVELPEVLEEQFWR